MTGRVAIVTGGAEHWQGHRGELAREGADVAVCGRNRDALDEAAQALAKDTGRRILAIVADTTKWESVTRLVDTVVAELGRVDILVNNAATPGGLVSGPLADADETALLEDINTKVLGYLRCAKPPPRTCRPGGAASSHRRPLRPRSGQISGSATPPSST